VYAPDVGGGWRLVVTVRGGGVGGRCREWTRPGGNCWCIPVSYRIHSRRPSIGRWYSRSPPGPSVVDLRAAAQFACGDHPRRRRAVDIDAIEASRPSAGRRARCESSGDFGHDRKRFRHEECGVEWTPSECESAPESAAGRSESARGPPLCAPSRSSWANGPMAIDPIPARASAIPCR